MIDSPMAAGRGGLVANSPQGWIGNAAMAGGKAYAMISSGLLHYRLLGPRDGPPVLLIHQTPWSMAQYAGVQPVLAEQGFLAIAPDTPGYGMSDPPRCQPTVPDYARFMIELLDHLGIARCVVAGHHTGAVVAACLAVRYPDRIAGVVMHGAAAFSAEERRERLSHAPYERALRADGSHLAERFSRIYAATDQTPDNLVTTNWSTLCFFMCGAADVAYAAVFSHDGLADLRDIAVPALILTDERDGLHPYDLVASRMRPDIPMVVFSGNSAHAFMNEPARWAAIVGEFARQCLGQCLE